MTPPLLSSNEQTSVEQLGEAIADIAAGIHAAIYQLLVLLREFDERKGSISVPRARRFASPVRCRTCRC